MSRIIRRPSLVFPSGRAPGFDSRHPAARRPLFSCVPNGKEWINLLNGKASTSSGSHTAFLDGGLGPTVYCSGDSVGSYFAVAPATNEFALTLAAIFTPTDISGPYYRYLFHVHNSGSPNGYALGHYLGKPKLIKYGVGAIHPDFTLEVGKPYFFAVSLNATRTITVLKRLDTGAILYEDVSDTSSPTNNSNNRVSLGNAYHFGGESANARLAAMMVSEHAATRGELLAWADDPWSFWYPHPVARARVGASAASFLSAWAANANSIIQPGVKL